MRLTQLPVVLASAALLFAADPYVGTWKLNTAKTKYKTGTPPKAATATMTESGSDLIIKVTGIAADGKNTLVSYSVPKAGGTGKFLAPNPAYDGISSKHIAADEREITYTKGGKVVYTTHSKLSGNTLTVHVKGVNPSGQTIDATSVYEREP